MQEGNSLTYWIAAIVLLHFVVGIAYLLYKIGGAGKQAPAEQEEREEG